MNQRTFVCEGLGFFCEKAGRIIAACWTEDKFVAGEAENVYSLDERTFRQHLEAEGFDPGDPDDPDESFFWEEPNGTFI